MKLRWCSSVLSNFNPCLYASFTPKPHTLLCANGRVLLSRVGGPGYPRSLCSPTTCITPLAPQGIYMVAQTAVHKTMIVLHATHNLMMGAHQVMDSVTVETTPTSVAENHIFSAREGTPYTLHKVVSIFTSRDSECTDVACADTESQASFIKSLALQELKSLTSYTDKRNLMFVHVFKPHEVLATADHCMLNLFLM